MITFISQVHVWWTDSGFHIQSSPIDTYNYIHIYNYSKRKIKSQRETEYHVFLNTDITFVNIFKNKRMDKEPVLQLAMPKPP